MWVTTSKFCTALKYHIFSLIRHCFKVISTMGIALFKGQMHFEIHCSLSFEEMYTYGGFCLSSAKNQLENLISMYFASVESMLQCHIHVLAHIKMHGHTSMTISLT